ncbi:hypothetical protein ABZ860_12675 [Microbispora sp. NPDC046973]
MRTRRGRSLAGTGHRTHPAATRKNGNAVAVDVVGRAGTKNTAVAR